MTAQVLLSRLDGVRQTGPGRWIARCPAHPDKRPSLSIREGHTAALVKCWSGCDVDQICEAVGLTVSDLFPPRPAHERVQHREQFDARDVLRCLADTVMLFAVAAAEVKAGRPMQVRDAADLFIAADRILDAARHVGAIPSVDDAVKASNRLVFV